MRLFKEIGKKIADKLFGPAYEIEVSAGSSEYGNTAVGRANFVARPVERLMIRRFPYTAFGMIVERIDWGTLVIGMWEHPDPAKNTEFPCYYAKYCRPRHIVECPKLFLERVPGFEKYRTQINMTIDYDKELVCAR